MGKKVFSVYMGDPDSSSHSELDLPATPWELIDALDKLRLEDGRESYWQVEDIGRYGFLAPLLDDSDLYQFNALAEQLSTFDHVEAIAFEGLVQMEVDKLCQTNGGELTLQRLLDLAYSVDGCHVVPEVRDDAALGRFYVENDFLSELEQVPDSVLELLDYAKIGEKMRRDEHGAMTPNGYVVREAELRQAPPNLGRPPRKPPYTRQVGWSTAMWPAAAPPSSPYWSACGRTRSWTRCTSVWIMTRRVRMLATVCWIPWRIWATMWSVCARRGRTGTMTCGQSGAKRKPRQHKAVGVNSFIQHQLPIQRLLF